MRYAAVFLVGALILSSTHATDTGSTGTGDPIGTMQPSLALNCGLASGGSFPGPGSGCGAGGINMVAEIRLFAGSFVPAGFYPADGRLLPISQNTALFSLLFTTYGGNGLSTFALPDLRGRAIAGRGGRPGLTTRALGEMLGGESVTLSLLGLPAHAHAGPGGATAPTGGGAPISTLQPTLVLQPLMCSYVMSPDYASEIRLFAGSVEPDLSCDGRLLPVDEYPDLFASLGTHYGGDGVASFGIPDLRSEVAIGAGAGPGLPPRFLGEYVGVESIALTAAELASHAHAFASGSTGSSGLGQAFENHQPTLAIRFAIAFAGVFPSTDTPNYSEVPTIGEIRPFAGDGPLPSGWFYADGQFLPIAPYTGLFSVITTTYGGDGMSTFRLPDLRGRTPICTGQGVGLTNRVRGEATGTPTTTIALSQLPPHTHVLDPTNTRVPGEPSVLRVGKNALDPSKIDLTWGVGCPSGATGFAVYEGTLGAFTSHAVLGGACGLTGSSLTAQTPCAGNCYYLVSAVDDVVGEEGSLGHTSAGVEIARPSVPCRAAVDLEGCVLN